MDEAPKTKRKKTGGRTKGTPNRRTVSRQVAAELALHRSGKIKLAREVLADIMNLAYELMRKACGEKVDTKEFNRYADMAMKAAVELIPYEQPRLNAITVMPGGIASKEEFERRQRLRVSIDIFNDRGELIESAHQDDVNIRELPLLEQSRSS